MKTVDARGLNCPEPVIRSKRALEETDKIEVLVDNETALENVRRLAQSSGCSEKYEILPGGDFRISIRRTNANSETSDQNKPDIYGPTVVQISSDTMGKGDDELGKTIMKAFIHTLTEIEVPDIIIMYNSGVKLAVNNTQTADDLKILMAKGVTILLCGTCVNFFNIKDQIATGSISNMLDIAGTLIKAGRIICP